MHMTWNTVNHGLFYNSFENKDTLFWVEVFSDLAYEFCCCAEISVNRILPQSGHLVQWHRDFSGWVSKDCALSSPKTIRRLGAVTLWLFILGVSNDQASSKPKTIWAPDAVILEIFFLSISNDWATLSTEIFEINIYFEYGLDADLFQMMSEFLSSREKIALKFVCEVNAFLLVVSVFSFNLS